MQDLLLSRDSLTDAQRLYIYGMRDSLGEPSPNLVWEACLSYAPLALCTINLFPHAAWLDPLIRVGFFATWLTTILVWLHYAHLFLVLANLFDLTKKYETKPTEALAAELREKSRNFFKRNRTSTFRRGVGIARIVVLAANGLIVLPMLIILLVVLGLFDPAIRAGVALEIVETLHPKEG